MATNVKRDSEYVSDGASAVENVVCVDGQCYSFGPNETKSFLNETLGDLVASGAKCTDDNKDKIKVKPDDKS